MIFGYSLSLPCDSRHRRYITEASTFAGEYVFGSFSSEMTDSRMVRTFCVGFHRSHGSSPLCGSSTGGWRIEMHRSPFWRGVSYRWFLDVVVLMFSTQFYNNHLVNVRMPDFGQEADRRRRIRIVGREFHVSLPALMWNV